jgi:hypothetical protein
MSTRSYIGIVNDDERVRLVYCHFDSYQNLDILINNYNTPDKINELLDMGDIRSLGPTISESEFYIRDCNEDSGYNKARIACCISEFLLECVEDYTFLFKNGKWIWRQWSKPLSED